MLPTARSSGEWIAAQVMDRLGFDLSGWSVGVAGDAAGYAHVRSVWPRARLSWLEPGQNYDLALLLPGTDRSETPGETWDLPALLATCRWVATTAPDAPGAWEALDDFPVAHRFVFPDFIAPDAGSLGLPSERKLRFGYLLQGDRQRTLIPLRPARDMLLPAARRPPLVTSGRKLLFLSSRVWSQLLAGEYFDPAYIRVLHAKADCDEGCDAHFNPGLEALPRAIDRAFPDWEPDVVLVVCPEYHAIPLGIEACPWPTVALISDWNVNLRDLVVCLQAFDLILGDANGMQRLRALGFSNVHYWPMYSFNADLHHPKVETVRHDLTFVGNLNHSIQRERSRYLHQVAQMSESIQVFLGVGLFGADYARVLQESRIVFNRSVRGELNLRCYEAPACGAMLMLEDTNSEARTLFRDGEDCVYYDSTTLVALTHRFVADEPERARIAQNGRRRAVASSYSAHFSALLGLVEDLLQADRPDRTFRLKPESERLGLLGRVAYRRTGGDRMRISFDFFETASSLAERGADLQADLACVMATLADAMSEDGHAVSGSRDAEHAGQVEETATRAASLFASALASQPNNPIWALNAAWFLRKRDPVRAGELLAGIVEGDEGQCVGLMYPMEFRPVEVELEAVWATQIGRPDEQAAEMRRLLAWQAALWLGDRHAGKPQWSAEPVEPRWDQALEWYRVATGLRPDLPESQTKLGWALLELGEPRGAAIAFRAALDDNPLSIMATHGMLAALIRSGKQAEATEFYDECLAYLPAIPQLAERLPELRQAYWAEIGRTSPEDTQGDRFSLEGLRAVNHLLFAEGPQESWQPGLETYVRETPSGRDACLVIYSGDRAPDVLMTEIEAWFSRAGVDPEAAPDILIVDRQLSDRQERELIGLSTAVYRGLTADRHALVAAIGRPLFGGPAGANP
jgi:tetratricopeptide (TPR) repeat protein